jgi:hypothetical protein
VERPSVERERDGVRLKCFVSSVVLGASLEGIAGVPCKNVLLFLNKKCSAKLFMGWNSLRAGCSQ